MGFSNYSKQAPQQGKTVPYVLRGLRNPDGSHPVLHVEHLGEANRPFWLDALAKSSARVRAGGRVEGTPVERDRAHRENRDDGRESVISYSAKKVDNAFHDDGSPATASDIRAIVVAIPDEDFDRLWTFVCSGDNFRDYSIADAPANIAEK